MHSDEDVDLRRDPVVPQICHGCALLRPREVTDLPVRPQGRRYLPHGYGEEAPYRPHIKHIEPDFTECGLDWKSRLRWLPQPRYSDAPFPEIKAIKFPNDTRLQRSFPHANMISASEWSFYPSLGLPVTYHVGKRCLIDGIHHYRSSRSCFERTVELRLGKKRLVQSPCCVDRGPRPYISPERSTDFHKFGSTLPTVGFGYVVPAFHHMMKNVKEAMTMKPYQTDSIKRWEGPHSSWRFGYFGMARGLSSATLKGDTFIPLQRPAVRQRLTYQQKEATKEREAEVLEVRKLADWRPAMPITLPIFDGRHGKHKKGDSSWRTAQGEKLASSIFALLSTKIS